jgi:membrane glycosyltransferase
MGYLASPLWLLMLGLTTAQGIRENLLPHPYFPQPHSLYPNWPVGVGSAALGLFLLIIGLLLMPKVLSILLHLRRARAVQFGGRARLVASGILELLLSTLLAPSLALLQSRFVISILMGSNAKWEAQDRGDNGTPWLEAVRYHWQGTVLGCAWTIILTWGAPHLIAWFSPALLGLVLSIPLSVWTSRAQLGFAARRLGLFLIPEETQPPQVIRTLEAELVRNAKREWCASVDPLLRILNEPEVRELHLALISASSQLSDPIQEHQRQGIILRFQQRGHETLTAQEKRELLLDGAAIQQLVESCARAQPERRSNLPDPESVAA